MVHVPVIQFSLEKGLFPDRKTPEKNTSFTVFSKQFNKYTPKTGYLQLIFSSRIKIFANLPLCSPQELYF